MQLSEHARASEDKWQTLSTDVHFENAHLTVATVTVQTPACSNPQSWTTVQRKRAVIIAPLTADGRLVLIRQERIPIRCAIWEVPAGQVDDSDNAAEVALRELREETGYQLSGDGELIPLGDFFSSPGFTDEQGFFFLARPVELSASGAAHQESESILECRSFSAAEIAQMIANNEVRDANTLSICAKLVARGLLSLASC